MNTPDPPWGNDWTESQHAEEATTLPPWRGKVLLGLMLVLGGVLVMTAIGLREERDLARQPWHGALLCVMGEAPWQGMERTSLRYLEAENLPELDFDVDALREATGGNELVDALGLDLHESVVLKTIRPAEIPILLESGRMPETGKPEVLAGNLTRFDTFVMDGEAFEVVGRVRRSVPCFDFCYILPASEERARHFESGQGGEAAWFDPAGLQRIQGDEAAQQAIVDAEVLGGLQLVKPIYALATMVGLCVVAIGGAFALIVLLRRLSHSRRGPYSPVLRALDDSPRLFYAMHLLLYGVFFAAMAAGLARPLYAFRVMEFVAREFSGDSSLGDIGSAYASGNILWAALMTFRQNFVVATLILSVLPSLIVPFFGVLKNIVSFGLVGFALTPIVAGSALRFSYHSITMAVELEAYIIASFVICIWPIRLVRGLLKGGFRTELSEASKIVGSGTLLSALMLALAAIYEAATLILLN